MLSYKPRCSNLRKKKWAQWGSWRIPGPCPGQHHRGRARTADRAPKKKLVFSDFLSLVTNLTGNAVGLHTIKCIQLRFSATVRCKIWGWIPAKALCIFVRIMWQVHFPASSEVCLYIAEHGIQQEFSNCSLEIQPCLGGMGEKGGKGIGRRHGRSNWRVGFQVRFMLISDTIMTLDRESQEMILTHHLLD